MQLGVPPSSLSENGRAARGYFPCGTPSSRRPPNLSTNAYAVSRVDRKARVLPFAATRLPFAASFGDAAIVCALPSRSYVVFRSPRTLGLCRIWGASRELCTTLLQRASDCSRCGRSNGRSILVWMLICKERPRVQRWWLSGMADKLCASIAAGILSGA